MYSVYLDSILLNDPVGGIEDFTLTLERTFDSDNIFREFSESTLTFTGDGFNYLCSKLKEDYCSKVAIQVDIYGQSIFEGEIVVSFGTVNYTKRTFETQIVDTSYRGLIRERTKNDINLNSILSVGCQPILPIPTIDLPLYDVDNNYVRNATVFNVYEVFKFLVASMSDNQVAFQSTYLQSIPFAITTGWNLSGTSNALPFRIYPEISFEQLYKTFRNLRTLYASLEIIAGQPTIVMEQEGYFFENSASGVTLSDIPYNTEISVDESRIYSVVEIGSDDYDNKDTDNNPFDNLKINGWAKRRLNSCGCIFDSDNTEDLTVDWTIDSGKITKAIVDTDAEDEIFIIQLDPANTSQPFRLQNTVNNKWYYNSSLRNEIVSILWSVQFNNCIYSTRTSDNSFRTVAAPPPPPYPSPLPDDIQFLIASSTCTELPMLTGIWMYYPQVQYDTYSGIGVQNGNEPCAGGILPKHTTYECQNFGVYAFTASREISTLYATLIGSTIDFDLIISINVYEDSSFSNLLYVKNEIDSFTASSTNFPSGFVKTLTVNSDSLLLAPGNVVRVLFSVIANLSSGTFSGNINTVFTNGVFQSNDELVACSDIPPEGNRIPYIMKFEQPMCKDDYDLINANRRNYIDIAGYKGWVKRLEYNPKGIGTFELLTEEIPCCDAI